MIRTSFRGCVKQQAGGCWAIPTGAERVGKNRECQSHGEQLLLEQVLALLCPASAFAPRPSVHARAFPHEEKEKKERSAEREESGRETAATTRSVFPAKLLFMSPSAVPTRVCFILGFNISVLKPELEERLHTLAASQLQSRVFPQASPQLLTPYSSATS